MATQRQINTNRANAQKSSAQRTEHCLVNKRSTDAYQPARRGAAAFSSLAHTSNAPQLMSHNESRFDSPSQSALNQLTKPTQQRKIAKQTQLSLAESTT
jgi:hypothetical protein